MSVNLPTSHAETPYTYICIKAERFTAAKPEVYFFDRS